MKELLRRVNGRICLWLFRLLYSKEFRRIGRNSFLYSPFRLEGSSNIIIGNNTVFQSNSWLYSLNTSGGSVTLEVGEGCVFGYNNHITAIESVRIGDHVLTANNVYISDNLHCYEDIHLPIIHQPVRMKKEVEIGSGSWLGENVCIIGARIGRNCVIGANAVVTQDIPDYCVAVGVPARVIRYYDSVQLAWISGAPPSSRASIN